MYKINIYNIQEKMYKYVPARTMLCLRNTFISVYTYANIIMTFLSTKICILWITQATLSHVQILDSRTEKFLNIQDTRSYVASSLFTYVHNPSYFCNNL